MRLFLASLLCLSALPCLHAGDDAPTTLFFEKVEPKALTTLSLHVDGSKVTGNQHWIPKDMDGAHGTVDGTLKDGVFHLTYAYSIEGSEQTEEQMFKLQDGKLIKGEGEMKDPKDDGKVVFRDRSQVTFGKEALTQVACYEPLPGTPERKALMDGMRAPVSKHVGKPVKFTGTVRVCKNWARFSGDVATQDGKPPAREEVAEEMELDFVAYLKKAKDGSWVPVHWGFTGDVGIMEEAREKCPGASWVLFE